MFNISGTELMFLLLAGMVVLGPDRLPGVMRKAGRVYGELRRMANGYDREFKETFAEPIREFRSAAREIEKEVRAFGRVDESPSPPMRPERAVRPEGETDQPAGTEPAGGAHVEVESGSGKASAPEGSSETSDADVSEVAQIAEAAQNGTPTDGEAR